MDFKNKIAQVIKSQINLDLETINRLIEIPPKPEMGDYTLPCFQLVNSLKKSPNDIAEELRENIDNDEFERIENFGPYLNFFINKGDFAKNILEKIILEGKDYGKSEIGKGKTICIEYSSPNIAKQLDVGQLFTTVIGNSLYKLFKKEGYTVKGLNYLGDWGIRFGKLISAYNRWGNEEELEKDAISELLRVYVKFHEEIDNNKVLEEEGREYFEALENGDLGFEKIWNRFRELSLKSFKEIYDIFNVEFDSYEGEKLYKYKIDTIVNELEEKKMLVECNGAHVVMLDEYNMPPYIVLNEKKVHISTSSRYLVTALYRKKTYEFDKCIYVIGTPQVLHFKQAFKVLECAGHEWARDCINVSVGLVKFADKKLSSKNGEVLLLDNLIKDAIDKALEIINKKNKSLENKEEVAKKIAVGAIVFNYLKSPRKKCIVFDWKEIFSIEGETGPYVQYSYARANNILIKVGEIKGKAEFSKLNSKEEFELMKSLDNFSVVIHNAIEKLEPAVIAMYIIEVTNRFNKLYNSYSILNLEDTGLMKARVILIEATCQVVRNSLELIGVEVIEEI